MHLALSTGSRNDPRGLDGLAHLCEHLAYAGLNVNQPRSYPGLVQARGGVPGAFTTYDRTHYFEILPANQILLGLWIEADRLRQRDAQISAELLDRERQVLLQERSQHVENPPYGQLYEDLHRLLYPEPHPYGRPPMGSREGLEAIGAEDCVLHLEASLSTTNAVLVLAGDFALEPVRQVVEELYSSLEPSPVASSTTGSGSALAGERRATTDERVPFVRTLLAFQGPPEGTDEFCVASVMAATLAGRHDSLLERRLVSELGLATAVSAGVVGMRDCSTLVLDATASTGTTAEQLEAALTECFEDSLSQSFSEGLLASARTHELKKLADEIDSLESRGELLARLEHQSSCPRSLEQEMACYGAVEPAEVTAFAERYCQPRHRVVLSTVPSGRER